MSHWLMIAGLGCGLGGALMVAVGDSWFSRSLLIYLDAIEENVANLVKAIRTGSADLESTGINLKRDRSQNRARALKLLGWVLLTLGFGLQFAAVWRNSTVTS